jgi:glutamate--cysteine ligase
MLVRDAGRVVPVTRRIPFLDWLRGVAPIDRRPTLDDLEYHLTTLFPPVRPRGYLEVRYLDALPDRWWPALAAATAVLANDPVASDIAAEAALPVAGRWVKAARAGLGDPALRRAAERCLDAAARRCPAPLAAEVGALADAVAGGRGPLAELHERLAAVGPLGVLAETAEGTEGGRG